MALLVVVPAPIGPGGPVTPVTLAAAPLAVGSDLDAHDAAVRQTFAQVQAAVTASAELRAVPSNLQPSLADAAAELGDVYVNGCLRSAWQVEQPDCASGEIGSPTT
ncbi:acyltransferase, partial [Mycobacterium sp. ITM-2017-0098]